MSLRLKFFLSGIGFFFLFVLFSYLVHKDIFTQFDFDTTVRLQDNISRRFDDIFSFLSDLGSFETTTVAVFVLFIFLMAQKKFLASIVAGASYVGFHIIELFGKTAVSHPPPPQFMLRTKEIVEFPQFHVRSEFSYPSGHAGRAAFLSVLLLIVIWQQKPLSRPLKIILTFIVLGYDAVMFISRPYLGEHWSSDVVGGMLLGTAFGLISGVFLIQETRSTQKTREARLFEA